MEELLKKVLFKNYLEKQSLFSKLSSSEIGVVKAMYISDEGYGHIVRQYAIYEHKKIIPILNTRSRHTEILGLQQKFQNETVIDKFNIIDGIKKTELRSSQDYYFLIIMKSQKNSC